METENRKLPELNLTELTVEFQKRFSFVKNIQLMMITLPELEECCDCNTIKDVVSCSTLIEDEANFKVGLIDEISDFLRTYSSALHLFK